jgi:hypothetical protein
MASGADVSERDVVKRDLEGMFPWAPDPALDDAADLVVTQLDKYEDQPAYTMERFESARAAGEKLAEVVGPVPAVADYVANSGGLSGLRINARHLGDYVRRIGGEALHRRSAR